MYSVDSLERAITRLFHDGIGAQCGCDAEEAEELLRGIDFDALLQAVRHKARTVHRCTVQNNVPRFLSYRSGELFDQRATQLYEDFDQQADGKVRISRTLELWLLEDMTLTVTACVTVSCGEDSCVMEYREDKGSPWDCGMCLDLKELTEQLNRLCVPYYEYETPMYEL